MFFHLYLVTLSLCGIPIVTEAYRNDGFRYIESPRRTNYGDWGTWKYCPEGSWVTGVNLKIENSQGGGDDTALNGIELTCDNMKGEHVDWIRSSEGPWGYYRGVKYCSTGFMTGFELRSESDQGKGDDAGAIDLAQFCGNGEEHIVGGIHQWGSWTVRQYCPPQTAVCGIRTQVEGSQGKGDDTALNNVQMECCKIPHPAETCTVTPVWKTIMACHAGITNCKINYTTNKMTVNEQSSSQNWSTTEYKKFGFDMSVEYGMKTFTARASVNGEMGIEKTTKKQLSTLLSESLSKEETLSFSIGCIGAAQELYIVCGPYEISTREYRCVPDVIQNKLRL